MFSMVKKSRAIACNLLQSTFCIDRKYVDFKETGLFKLTETCSIQLMQYIFHMVINQIKSRALLSDL